MPRSTQNDQLADWAALLRAVRENEGELAGVESLREALEKALDQGRVYKNIRESLAQSTADMTSRLRQSLTEGQDAASCLRSFVRGILGPRNPKLILYGVKPLGRRRRRARVVVPQPEA